MSSVWGTGGRDGSDGGKTPNELSEIEVDEVSLVDRPATGKRFVLFKRGGLLRRSSATTENKCSGEAGRLEHLEKAAAQTDEQIAAIRDLADRIDRRLAAVEAGCAPRQSAETPDKPPRLWAGLL